MASPGKDTGSLEGGTTPASTDMVAGTSKSGNAPAEPSTGVIDTYCRDEDVPLSEELMELLQRPENEFPLEFDPHCAGSTTSSGSSSDSSGDSHTGAPRNYLSLICARKDHKNPNQEASIGVITRGAKAHGLLS